MQAHADYAIRVVDEVVADFGLDSQMRTEAYNLVYQIEAGGCISITKNNRDEIGGAAILIAIRNADIPLTAGEIASVVGCREAKMHNVRKKVTSTESIEWKLSDPHNYLNRIASTLDLSDSFQLDAAELIDAVSDIESAIGRNPNIIAASCVYIQMLASDSVFDQEELAQAANCSPEAIRECYQAFVPLVNGNLLHIPNREFSDDN